MQQYSTRNVSSCSKLKYWNELACRVFAPMEARSLNRSFFEAELDMAPLGKSWLANARCTAATVHREPAHAVRSRDRPFFLHLQLKGRLSVAQDGHQAILDRGDMVVTDSAIPYTLRFDEECSTLVMIAAAREFADRLPAPDDLLGVRLAGAGGIAGAASSLLTGIWREACNGEIPEPSGASLASAMLDVFAASWIANTDAQVPESSVMISRRIRIRRYIEANLRDPDLSASTIAAAFGISPRYLHVIFATGEETVSNLILRRRLEECAKLLRDPRWAGRTITDIAFTWGFNTPTHVARVFREKYGQSPRAYRAAHRAG